ncbi:hypothetical protein DFJ58DRAFT_764099 [Suillus subalutaceus]|uniref:uncharacterized protein n=1 Tax=Suillus subalutaceus TaxID=48586 RepID=UPI001B8604D1|nr:uncharacterized protein DFJ58DRAFT_764099 [Suillus subalutaceus]KAG1870678.1 hypothetical protein DFJ58DRAFT_764099 [Suillus subalutaceus]
MGHFPTLRTVVFSLRINTTTGYFRATLEPRTQVSRCTIFVDFSLICNFSMLMQLPGLFQTSVSCQLLPDNEPLTVPFRTSFKAFKNNYACALFHLYFNRADYLFMQVERMVNVTHSVLGQVKLTWHCHKS